MSEVGNVTLLPISGGDVQRVGEFLHQNLNRRLSVRDWANCIIPPWTVASPNHGFLLEDRGCVVGVYLAFYSTRHIDGKDEPFCNLGAWCVLRDYREHAVRLLRALLSQKQYTFTDLSPSGNVLAVNKRLKFEVLNTSAALVPNWPLGRRRYRTAILTSPTDIAQVLTGANLQIYRDHLAAAAARLFVIVSGAEHCYIVARKDRRKNLPLFATIIYVSDLAVFRRCASAAMRHLLVQHGAMATLVELRVVGFRPRFSVQLRTPRPKMYRSDRIGPDKIDHLYSELVCVGW